MIRVYNVQGRVLQADEEANQATEQALATTLSLSTKDITLGALIEFVRVGADVNLVVNWPALELVGIDPNSKVTVYTKELSARKLLEIALDQAGADALDDEKPGVSLREGVVHVSTLRELNRHTETRVYDIQWFVRPNNALSLQIYREIPEAAELLRFVSHPSNPISERLEKGGLYCAICRAVTNPDGTVDCHSFQTRVDQLIDLITTTVGDPDEWLDEESIIDDIDRQLVIKTTPDNHAGVFSLLNSIRRAQIQAFDHQAREIEVALLLQKAEAHRLQQQDREALELVSRALRVYPEHPEACVLKTIITDVMAE